MHDDIKAELAKLLLIIFLLVGIIVVSYNGTPKSEHRKPPTVLEKP